MPKPVPITAEGEHDEPTTIVDKDEPPYAQCLDEPEVAYERMTKLEPRFKKLEEGGRVTAGNSSKIVDGAAACMLMSKQKAKELGLEPMVTIRSMAVGGTEPKIMLLGPLPAQMILRRTTEFLSYLNLA